MEDLELARAWISISEDRIKGSEQRSDTFWDNLNTLWSTKTKGQRSTQSLKNRWSLLQRSVQKFCGYYQKVFALNESGTTDEDKISKAEVNVCFAGRISIYFQSLLENTC